MTDAIARASRCADRRGPARGDADRRPGRHGRTRADRAGRRRWRVHLGRAPGRADAGPDGRERRRCADRLGAPSLFASGSSTALGSRSTSPAPRSRCSPAASTTSLPGCPRSWPRCGRCPPQSWSPTARSSRCDRTDDRSRFRPQRRDRNSPGRQPRPMRALTPYLFDLLYLDGATCSTRRPSERARGAGRRSSRRSIGSAH